MINNYHAESWTEGSIFCYKRGCNCNGCFVKDLMESQNCRMKSSVIELVKKFGIPSNDEKTLTPTQQKIIDAILKGCNSKYEIARQTGLTEENANTTLSTMYEIAENDGVVYKNLRHKLPDFIRWVRGNE